MTFESSPWQKAKNPIWIASTLKLYRNLDKHKFPGKLDMEPRQQILSLIKHAFSNVKSLENPQFIQAENLEPTNKEYLFEHFLSSHSFNRAHKGEGFVIDDKGEFLAILNIREHIQLQITECNGELEQAWNRLTQVESEISKNLHFAYSSRFGFLTADHLKCGTGLIVHILLHVPALIHTKQLDELKELAHKDGISIGGMQDDTESFVGDVITIHNRYTLGTNEETIISSLRTLATKIMLAEQGARSQLKHERNSHIQNLVNRALGLLTHSIELDTAEALDALSLLRLGQDVDYIKNIEASTLNEAFFLCRRAHLLYLDPNKSNLPAEQIAAYRASYVQDQVKNCQLS